MKKNLFGTDGVRGPVNTHPFTPDALPEFGKAIGAWICQKYGAGASILLVHDTRESCSWVKTTLASGMLLHPLNLHDAGVLPTPAALCLMQKTMTQFSCGIVISASHNPYHDNGIKIIDTKTGKISEADEIAITNFFYGAVHQLPTFGTYHALSNAAEQYITTVGSLLPPHFLRGKRIILDCANGATSWTAPIIFERYGAQVTVINNSPTGTNINRSCGALAPQELQKIVLSTEADAGFAFDGDGDRVIAVNNRGDIKNGDDLLAILSQHPRYREQRAVVGTVMANQGFELFLHEHKKALIRTGVGDKYVAQELEANQLLLGGEQSGHLILRDYLGTGDGIVAALYTLEAMLLTNNSSMETFTHYPQVLLNVRVPHKKDLTLSPLREIIEEGEKKLLKGRLLVRYSGTESVLRIMAEAESTELAQQTVTAMSEKLLRVI